MNANIDSQKLIENEVTSKKIIKLEVKEFVAICWFILSLGVTIGGFAKVVNDVNNISAKADDINKEVTALKVQNAELTTLVKGKDVLK